MRGKTAETYDQARTMFFTSCSDSLVKVYITHLIIIPKRDVMLGAFIYTNIDVVK